LLNALARSNVAIVTDEPGTTRDVRETAVDLGGQLVILLDMAGLRETESKAEAEGVRRARAEIASADLVLWLAAPDVETADAPPGGAWIVGTKADLGRAADFAVSAVSGTGMAELIERLTVFAASAAGTGEPVLLSRERDRVALEGAAVGLGDALARLDQPELAAEALRLASAALERLLGRMDAEAVLDRLFSSFCIGK
jgi:tRNA modification GTPase